MLYLNDNRLVGVHEGTVLQVTRELEVIKKANNAHVTCVTVFLQLQQPTSSSSLCKLGNAVHVYCYPPPH